MQLGSSAPSIADDAYTVDFDDDDAGQAGPSGRGPAAASVSESGVYTEDWHGSSDAIQSGSGLPSEIQSETREDHRSVGGGSASVAEEIGSASASASAARKPGDQQRAGGYSDTFEDDSVAEEFSGGGASEIPAKGARHQVRF